MGGVLGEQNVVIATASVPGKKAPILITREMVSRMPRGSVIGTSRSVAEEVSSNAQAQWPCLRGGRAYADWIGESEMRIRAGVTEDSQVRSV